MTSAAFSGEHLLAVPGVLQRARRSQELLGPDAVHVHGAAGV